MKTTDSRDLGYAIGAILTGIIADMIHVDASIILIVSLTFLSAVIIFYRMHCRVDSQPGTEEFSTKVLTSKSS